MKNRNTDVSIESVFSCLRLPGTKDQTRRWEMKRLVWSTKKEAVL